MERKIIGFGSNELVGMLDSFKDAKGLESRTSAIAFLLDYVRELKEQDKATFENIFPDTRPMVISGPSGSGKTTTAKALVARFDAPVFVIDTSREWEFEPVDYSRVSG